jgi:flagellar biogenesis protein FliO
MGSVRVIGRVSLSSRQSIFLVRAGQRVLLIGAGNQGAPSLLGEVTEAEQSWEPPDRALRPSSPDGCAARSFESARTRARSDLDINLGDDE